MKKIITLITLVAFILLLAGLAMAEDTQSESTKSRQGNIVVKVGVFVPTDDKYSTLTSTNWTLEGEYVFYSTDYFDFSGAVGYYRTGLPNAAYKNLAAHIDTLYYIGGVKVYPIKKDFYIGAFIGGATNWVSPDPAPLSGSNTAVFYKGSIGYEIDRFIIEGSYIAQSNEDLTYVVNHNPQRTTSGTTLFTNNSGIQIMGGYKF